MSDNLSFKHVKSERGREREAMCVWQDLKIE